MKKKLKYFLGLLILLLVFVIAVDAYISKSTQRQLYSDARTIRYNKVALLLGTSKFNSIGTANLYYKYRIEAALELYKVGKIKYVIVSGDNSRNDYNEPEQMQQDLIAGGIPAENIFLDFAGFRTLDSIVRCKAIFGTDKFTIISQEFHNERALFIANKKHLHAIAYNAQDPPKKLQVKVMIREKLARVKVMLDMLFNKQPKFLGEKITIPV